MENKKLPEAPMMNLGLKIVLTLMVICCLSIPFDRSFPIHGFVESLWRGFMTGFVLAMVVWGGRR